MFDEMLAIKRFREQQAELALLRQRQRRLEALEQVNIARESLKKYQVFAEEKERGLYRDLCEKLVQPREIENVLIEVAEMKVNEHSYATAVETAVDVVDQENETLTECRLLHEQTVRMTGKFTEIASVYWDQFAQEKLKLEDNELEEVAAISKRNGDMSFEDSDTE